MEAGGIAACSGSGMGSSVHLFSTALFIKLKGYIKLSGFPNQLNHVRPRFPYANRAGIYLTVPALCLWESGTAAILVPPGLQIHLVSVTESFFSSRVWDSLIENRYLVSLRIRTKDSSGAELCHQVSHSSTETILRCFSSTGNAWIAFPLPLTCKCKRISYPGHFLPGNIDRKWHYWHELMGWQGEVKRQEQIKVAQKLL